MLTYELYMEERNLRYFFLETRLLETLDYRW